MNPFGSDDDTRDHGGHGTQNDATDSGHGHDHDVGTLTFAVLVMSSSRSEDEDESGAIIREAIEDAGHEVGKYQVIPDDGAMLRREMKRPDEDVVVVTGGTGLTRDDVTVEHVDELVSTEIPGFGEHFRRLSHEQVGTAAMLSRAMAGIHRRTPIFALPGSPDAARLGITECVLPEVEHVVALARR